MRKALSSIPFVFVLACGGGASPSRAVANGPDPAAQAFSKDKLCPAGRVQVRPRTDVSTRRIGVVADKFRGLDDAPPAEVVRDPERMKLWREQRSAAEQEAARWRVEEVSGCGESVLYACKSMRFEWCVPFGSVVTLDEMMKNAAQRREGTAAATDAKLAALGKTLDQTKLPRLRACGGNAYELDVRTVGTCTLTLHSRDGTEENLAVERGHACELPTRKSTTQPVPLDLVAGKVELTGDLVEIKLSAKDLDGEPVTFAMTSRIERALQSEHCAR